ncbi:AMP-dependent synthetase/ligase [Lacipirellula limnantheis]|uniref:Long-chain-fatty-acid--CoA ligase FadD15 n=1 Tax=Lacipirellula limnantheis TaxID=2528024 RepID=A0A517U1F8_9BACT|nr:AMP-dependent synthetase/ligase [Lacipirellula limnantheis]QDT74443.1 Long-chain-fatty-acid--CoA ligase FadD15 [Lacipirellula limnantheis]
MATALSAATAVERPLAGVLFDHAGATPDVAAVFLPGDTAVRQITWREIASDVTRMAGLLARHGVVPGDRIVLWSDNRYEWIVADLAMQLVGAINVPLHDSLPAPAAAAQIAHSEPRLAIIVKEGLADDLQRQAPSLLNSDAILLIEAGSAAPALLERLADVDDDAARQVIEQRLAAFDPDSIATILYSSGTSGEPKAVALTHANISSNAYAVIDGLSEPSSERRMNFLPFSHIYARTCDLYAWLVGGSQIVLARSRDTVIADCGRTQPTLINGVPYFYQRVSQKVAEAEAAGAAVTLPQLFGGNLRACICGGAALPASTFDFYHARGLLMLPGYGLTESSPVIAMSSPDEFRRGTVGKAIPGIEVRIAEDGELLTRGPHVMKEYWKDPELSQQTIRDGWLYTGDMGAIDADGYISITGRKKELIALSTGKKAVPTHIEGVLSREPLIFQAMVVGDNQPYLAAVVVPDFDLLAKWAAAQGIAAASPADLIESPAVVELYRERIRSLLESLPPYERVKRFRLLHEPFTVAEGLLTPKLSLRRSMIQQRHQPGIAALYAGGGVNIDYGERS